jgi:hypothetical protein
MIKIGDEIYHPCSLDIIKHKVVSIRQYEGFNQYVAKSINSVGACGIIKVLLSENNGKLRFIELIDEYQYEYSKGLQDFVEGFYYTSESEAKLAFYNMHLLSSHSEMCRKQKQYEDSVKNYNKVKLLIDALTKLIKNEHNN